MERLYTKPPCAHLVDDGGCPGHYACARGEFGGRVTRGVCERLCKVYTAPAASAPRGRLLPTAETLSPYLAEVLPACTACPRHRGTRAPERPEVVRCAGCPSCTESFSLAFTACPEGRFPTFRTWQLRETFDRVVLINLRRNPERLAATLADIDRQPWPFRRPQVFEAVDASKLPLPDGWPNVGGARGAYGCLHSHRQVLERALMDGVRSTLILEDDLTLCPDFAGKAAAFLSAVPADWEIVHFGGEHMRPPEPVAAGVARSVNVQRTHCYGVRGQAIADLYKLWSGPAMRGRAHLDHVFGPWLASRRAYCPTPFLAGQRASYSEIMHRQETERFW